MKKRKRLKKKVIILIMLIIVLMVLVTGVILFTKSRETEKPKTTKVVNQIPEYGYVLEDNQTKLYKTLFMDLIDVLNKKEINYDEYAKLISCLAVADFYTLDNKVSKNDIGGVQFIREQNRDNFILEASETVYKYVKQNLDGKRQQELPEVSKIEVTSSKNEAYNKNNIKDDKAYVVNLKLEYTKDLGYPKEVTVKLLHSDKKLEIYYMK